MSSLHHSSNTQLSHKKLAVQLVGLLAESLGQSFEAHLPTFLPLLSHCLLLQHHYPDNEEEEPVSMTTSEPVSMATEESVSMENSVTEVGHREAGDETDILTENGVDSDNLETLEDESETERVAAPDERSLDHFLFGVVHVLCKLLTSCVALRSPVHRTVITTIMGNSVEISVFCSSLCSILFPLFPSHSELYSDPLTYSLTHSFSYCSLLSPLELVTP